MADHRASSPDSRDHEPRGASGRDKSTESEPTETGHSTANEQTRRNQENESPS
jgi:hypothetical protein